ncbi:hypothetical protein [Mesorhizobium sp.]|uniref:hypothetical protein n=1 Tax=Mesorhizobium sp. TaxID=1871066 RepID=UPI000FEA0546|nr:hypothetical protein [Mesorhizobium sp.]RWG33995.1 MAG: hypothetical protein EOQ60_10265 [Mesorhizobium sp.]TIS17639.1 MAG: hypothetical protein E5X10_02750 [Mesorhizobium sp.]
MAKAPDPRIIEILRKYEEDPRDAMWDCHGVWVVYHKAIERIAARAGISFDMPEIVEAKSAEKIAVIVARGFMGDRSEWSFGEAAPNNNKNAYPYAMAEKRAKDRVVLKLVGLHGLAYSEEESDDFKGEPTAQKPTRHALKKDIGNVAKPDRWDEFERELLECTTIPQLNRFKLAWSAIAEAQGWQDGELGWRTVAREEINKRQQVILNGLPDDDVFPGDRPSNGQHISTLQAG